MPKSPEADVRKAPAAERRIVALVAAVQFINVLDFVIVMPLGPDFAAGLQIPTASVGWIAASYTMSAAVVGAAGSFFLDKFDRRRALTVALSGLVFSTMCCGLSTGLGSLIATRVLAGLFGGPATALALARVTDSVPVERRGRALGIVMTAFSVASVLGVPTGLEIARLWGWRSAFFAVAVLGAVVTAFAAAWMPRGELTPEPDAELPASFRTTDLGEPAGRARALRWLDGAAGYSLAATFFVTVGVFAVVPNLSAYVQHNLGYPRSAIGFLYFAGGIANFVTLRLTGPLVDRVGSAPVFAGGVVLHSLALWMGLITPDWGAPVVAFFISYMVSGGMRMVALSTLSTRVPYAGQRARFMSAQSAVRHTGSAVGSACGAALLISLPDGNLDGMIQVGWVALALAWISLPLLTSVESRVRRRRPLVAQPAINAAK